MDTRNWAAIGFAWVVGEVGRRKGPNDSDKAPIGSGEIPQLVDTDKAITAGLGTAIMAGVNGTSWRVTAQDVIRSAIESGKFGRDHEKRSEELREELRERIFTRLKGMRSGGFTTREVIVAPLPDGTNWTGTDADEYEATYLEKLGEAEIPDEVAIGLAAKMALGVRAKLAK